MVQNLQQNVLAHSCLHTLQFPMFPTAGGPPSSTAKAGLPANHPSASPARPRPRLQLVLEARVTGTLKGGKGEGGRDYTSLALLSPCSGHYGPPPPPTPLRVPMIEGGSASLHDQPCPSELRKLKGLRGVGGQGLQDGAKPSPLEMGS